MICEPELDSREGLPLNAILAIWRCWHNRLGPGKLEQNSHQCRKPPWIEMFDDVTSEMSYTIIGWVTLVFTCPIKTTISHASLGPCH